MGCLTMSIMGIERYIVELEEASLFSNISLPEGIDKDLLVDTILNDSASFETVYSNPNYLRFVIKNWFKTHLFTFQKWVDALNIKYDPLNNYDRTETFVDVTNKNNKSNLNNTTNDIQAEYSKGESLDQTVGYESTAFTNKDKTNSDSMLNRNNVNTLDSTSNSQDMEEVTHTARLYGNIGVTTSQQMLQSELDIAKFNLIQQISDLFIQDFCLLVY